MVSRSQISIETRMRKAAEAALSHHQYVSAIDVLVGMGILQLSQVEDWRKGKIPYLERAVLGSLGKISRTMKAFRAWAKKCQLVPRETVYLARTKGSKKMLQFSKSSHPRIEKAYRTHFVSLALVEKRDSTQKH